MIVGLPSSGKTHRAAQLTSYFASHLPAPTAKDVSPSARQPHRIKTVTHISEHSLNLPRTAFADRNAEKTSRAALYSACKRALSRDTLVVLDAGNYIKGFRYQLHCEAKAAGVRSCVVHVGTPPAQAHAVNAARQQTSPDTVGGDAQDDAYAEQVWEELVMRFEEPNPMARWDAPLWAVVWDDADQSCGGAGSTAAQVWEQVVCGVGRDGKSLGEVRMNQATVLAPATAPNHLQELDRTTQTVLTQVQAWAQENADVPGGSVRIVMPVENSNGKSASDVESRADLVVHLPSTSSPSFAHLQRLRRQFIALHRQQLGGQGMMSIGQSGGGLQTGRIARLFVDWLNDSFAG